MGVRGLESVVRGKFAGLDTLAVSLQSRNFHEKLNQNEGGVDDIVHYNSSEKLSFLSS